MSSIEYKILKKTDEEEFIIPLFLECSTYELGGMVGFDGNIEQVEQINNFTYTQSGNSVTVYHTINANKAAQIIEANFTVDWGDNTSGEISFQNNSLTKNYQTNGVYKISLTLDTPWKKQKIERYITVPANTSVVNVLGTISGITVPNTTIQTDLNYLYDLDYTNYDSDATFRFVGIGKSRVSELKLYGTNTYSGITIISSGETPYTGYTIDGLYYRDFPDGMTMITGSTSEYQKEEVFNQMLTRNEHFIGFIDEPLIYSDVFVERGKQGIIERTLRLSEVDNIGEIEVYGNKFFTIVKQ